MITVRIPKTSLAERTYVINVILGDWLGLPHLVEPSDVQSYQLELPNGSCITIEDHFFGRFNGNDDCFTRENIPISIGRLSHRFAPEGDLPIIYGSERICEEQGGIRCTLDIFGSSFFMLTRWEEMVAVEKDEHDRFPASESLAFREGFLTRPVLDEYVGMLSSMMQHQCPAIEFGERVRTVFVTCDVDYPFDDSVSTPAKAIKRVAGDLLKRRSPQSAIQSALRAVGRLRNDYSRDPYNTFDWMMDVCDRYGRQVAFYFLSQKSSIEMCVQAMINTLDSKNETNRCIYIAFF